MRGLGDLLKPLNSSMVEWQTNRLPSDAGAGECYEPAAVLVLELMGVSFSGLWPQPCFPSDCCWCLAVLIPSPYQDLLVPPGWLGYDLPNGLSWRRGGGCGQALTP